MPLTPPRRSPARVAACSCKHVTMRPTSLRFLPPSMYRCRAAATVAVPRPRGRSRRTVAGLTIAGRTVAGSCAIAGTFATLRHVQGSFRPLRASSRHLPGLFHPGDIHGVTALQRSVHARGRTPLGWPCPSFPWPRTAFRCRKFGPWASCTVSGDSSVTRSVARTGQCRRLPTCLRLRVAPVFRSSCTERAGPTRVFTPRRDSCELAVLTSGGSGERTRLCRWSLQTSRHQ